MDENLESKKEELPEEAAVNDTSEAAVDTGPQEAPPAAEDEAPAEMSLEGRRTQLEEKVNAELHSPPAAPSPAAPQAAPSPSAYVSVPKAPKEKMSSGSRAYIIVIVGLLVIFLGAIIYECARTYNENGMFGGDLDRFLDTDYSEYTPFGHGGDDDDDDLGGIFPFDFDDSDDDDGSTIREPKSSGSDVSGIAKAPDSDSVVNEDAATLKAEDQPNDIDSASYTARKAYKKVENSVVNVVVYAKSNVVGQEAYKQGTGTGIIVSKDGYIITNSHVIEDTRESGVEIITTDGARYEAAIVGFDVRTDLAVLKIDASDLTPAEFVDSSQLEIGQDALAVGNPGGVEYSNSLTRGCVSALNRTVPSNTVVSYIQTDAAINPGNSGGPLLNSAGQVMGITTIKIANTDYEGMGFAIPSNTVIEIANSIIAKGYVAGRVRLGIVASVYTAGYSEDISGLQIKEIQEDSPLNDTEVKVGDVITKLDGDATPDFATLYTMLGEHDPGDSVTLTVYRAPSPGDSGKTFDVTIQLVADDGSTSK